MAENCMRHSFVSYRLGQPRMHRRRLLSRDTTRPFCSSTIANSFGRRMQRDFSLSDPPLERWRKKSFRFRLADFILGSRPAVAALPGRRAARPAGRGECGDRHPPTPLYARPGRRSVGQAFARDQPLEGGQPMFVVARAIVGLAHDRPLPSILRRVQRPTPSR